MMKILRSQLPLPIVVVALVVFVFMLVVFVCAVLAIALGWHFVEGSLPDNHTPPDPSAVITSAPLPTSERLLQEADSASAILREVQYAYLQAAGLFAIAEAIRYYADSAR